jgi:dephospho-CoA kinase
MIKEKKPIVVGITGGIGCGKTTILKAFENLGIPTYIADVRAKELMNENKELINQIKKQFGEDAYKDNAVNTSYLSAIVFDDKQALGRLNALVHPVVRKDFESWLHKQSSKFIVYESALIFEHGQEHIFDAIILVTAPVEQRIERVIKRNKISKEEVVKRIRNQMPDEEKVKKSTYIINNSNNTDYNNKVIGIYNKIINNH